MRKTIVTLYLSLWAVWAAAQPRFTSNTEEYRFGQVEWKRPVTATYTITNTGSVALRDLTLTPDMLARGNRLADMNIPRGTLVMLVKRGDEFLIPNGQMELHVGDKLLFISENRKP